MVDKVNRTTFGGMDKDAKIALFDGKPGDGKSTLCAYLLHKLQSQYEYGFILSTTIYNDDIWNKVTWLHKIEITTDVIEPLTAILNCQKEKVKKYKKSDFKTAAEARVPRLCLVFDDLVGRTRFGDKDTINMLATTRHIHTHVYITSQYTNSVQPMLRDLATEVYLSASSGDGIYKTMQAYFPSNTKKEQKEIMLKLAAKGDHVFGHLRRNNGEYRYVKVPRTFL